MPTFDSNSGRLMEILEKGGNITNPEQNKPPLLSILPSAVPYEETESSVNGI